MRLMRRSTRDGVIIVWTSACSAVRMPVMNAAVFGREVGDEREVV